MTETLVGVNPPSSKDPADPPSAEELAAAKELVRQARAQGVALTGPGGLLKALTKTVLETALEEEMAEHLGYDKHDPVGRNQGNPRNGKRAKTVLTDSGEVAVEVPRDREPPTATAASTLKLPRNTVRRSNSRCSSSVSNS